MELTGRSVVFLDRDGTINFDAGYVTDPALLILLPGVADAIATLRAAGYLVVVISNQSAIGRGMASSDDVDRTNEGLQALLLADNENARIDLWCYAPDHPDEASELRKPGIGMLKKVQEEFEVDIPTSWMVGDSITDIGFGLNAGIPAKQCIYLDSERFAESNRLEEPFVVVSSLAEAVTRIICGPSLESKVGK